MSSRQARRNPNFKQGSKQSTLDLTSSQSSNRAPRKAGSNIGGTDVKSGKMSDAEYAYRQRKRQRVKMQFIPDHEVHESQTKVIDVSSGEKKIKREKKRLSTGEPYLETPIIPFVINDKNHSLVVNNLKKVTLGSSNPSLNIDTESIPENALRLQIVRVPTLVFQLPHRQHNVHLNGERLNIDPEYWYSLPNSSSEPFEFNLTGSPSNLYTYNVSPLIDVKCIPDNKRCPLSPSIITAYCRDDSRNEIRIKKFNVPHQNDIQNEAELRTIKARIRILERSESKIKTLLDSVTINCAICQGIVIEAVSVNCKNKHVFCKTCLDDYFAVKLKDRVSLRNKPKKVKGECPSCRETILNVDTKTNEVIDINILTFIKSGLIGDKDLIQEFFDNGGGLSLSMKEKEKILVNCEEELPGCDDKNYVEEKPFKTTCESQSINSEFFDDKKFKKNTDQRSINGHVQEDKSIDGTFNDPIVL